MSHRKNPKKPNIFNLKSEFHELTLQYMQKTDLSYRKSKGQYFTPKSIRNQLLSQLPNKKEKPRVLDPACGTGEFLLSASKYFRIPRLFGWDIEQELINIAKKLVPQASLKTTDSLKIDVREKFDFVIGNPPYFEFKPNRLIRNKYRDIVNGRVNIFSLFIKLGIELLEEGGYLAYVIPPSMNNGAYFSNLRNYIIKHTNIEYLSVLNGSKLFHKALQSTMLLVLKKGKNRKDYTFEKNGILIFSEKPEYLRKTFHKKRTLRELGYTVKTGRLVWNQNKNLLTNDSKKGIPLIWAKNITLNGLQIPATNNNKPQYIFIDNHDVGPAIVVNRITGAVRAAKLKASIIPKGMKFIAENHVNVIYPPSKKEQLEIEFLSREEKKINMQEVVNQLKSREKVKVIQHITGNTQISKNELENLFPIDV